MGGNGWGEMGMMMDVVFCVHYYTMCIHFAIRHATHTNTPTTTPAPQHPPHNTTQGECPKDVTPRSFFSLTKVDCNKDTCHTFGQLFTNGSDLCETLWDGSFMYEPNEEDAYSLSWKPERTGGINPNSLVNAYLPFPDTCPGVKIDAV